MQSLVRPSLAGALAAAALLLAGCAGTKVWMRSGVSAGEAEGDELTCAEFSEGGGRGTVAYGAGTYDVTVGGGPGSGFNPPMDNFSQKSACLRSKGYRLATVTDEEERKLRGLVGEDKETYWRELMAKHGFKAESGPGAPPPAPAQPLAR